MKGMSVYQYLLRRFGASIALWGTSLWYAALLVLVALSFAGPAGEFRYGNL